MDAAEARRLTNESMAARLGVADLFKSVGEKIGQAARSGDDWVSLKRDPSCSISDWNVVMGLLERSGYHITYSVSRSVICGDEALVRW